MRLYDKKENQNKYYVPCLLLSEGLLCAVRYKKICNEWHRCQLMSIDRDNNCRLFLLDIGIRLSNRRSMIIHSLFFRWHHWSQGIWTTTFAEGVRETSATSDQSTTRRSPAKSHRSKQSWLWEKMVRLGQQYHCQTGGPQKLRFYEMCVHRLQGRPIPSLPQILRSLQIFRHQWLVVLTWGANWQRLGSDLSQRHTDRLILQRLFDISLPIDSLPKTSDLFNLENSVIIHFKVILFEFPRNISFKCFKDQLV